VASEPGSAVGGATPDPTEAYQAALAELQAAWRDLRTLIQYIEGVGEALRRSSRTTRTDRGDFPTTPVGGPLIRAEQWPTIETLTRQLARLHACYDRAQQAWRRVPEADQPRLPPPTSP
jgi:hypothetical protein